MADDVEIQEASEDELRERLETEFKQLKVGDVLVQTLFTISSLGYRSLGEDDLDLDQARLAIESLRALVPVLKGSVPEDLSRDLEQLIANMQLAYAKAAA